MKKTTSITNAKRVVLIFGLCLVLGLVACGNKDKQEKNNVVLPQEDINEIIVTDTKSLEMYVEEKGECPNGVCEVINAISEEECDEIGGRREDRSEKCIDETLQQITQKPSEIEKECKEKGGVYQLTGAGIEECIILPDESGKECAVPADCISKLCQVIDLNSKKGICRNNDEFSGCLNFLAPNKNVIRICK